MTPQELKNSILQLAVQGKLVEQRTEEGTAEELYKKIQAEKQKLTAEKKIKKEKPLPEITAEEIPFDIPESWKWVRLKDIVYNRGQMKPVEQFSYIDIGSIDNKRQLLNSEENIIQPDKAPSRARKIVAYGDILYSTVRPYLHNMCIINKTFSYMPIASTGFAVLTCCKGILNKFLFYYLLSPNFDSYANSNDNSKGVAYPAINDDKLYKGLVPLPPLEEQKRIVAKIEELLPQIDRYEKAWSKLEEFNKRFPENMQKSILQYAVQGKLVEQRAEEGTAEELYKKIQAEKQKLTAEKKIKKTKPLPEITDENVPTEFPKTWKICYLDDIAFVTKLAGFEYTKNIAPNLTFSGIPLFKGKNVQNGELVFDFDSYIPEKISDALPRSQILKKCLLTPYVGTIGNIAIFHGDFKAHLGSNVGKIELINDGNECVMEEYVLYYLRSQVGFQELTKYKKSTAQESISIDAIRNVIIGIPPLEEQKRIVAKIEELLPLCEKLKK